MYEFIRSSEDENIFFIEPVALNFHFASGSEATVLQSSIPNKMTVSKTDSHITFSFIYPALTEELPVGFEYREGNIMAGKYTGTLKGVSASNILMAQVLIMKHINEHFRLGVIGNMSLCLFCLSSYHRMMSAIPENGFPLYPQLTTNYVAENGFPLSTHLTTRETGKKKNVFGWLRGLLNG